MPIFDNGTMVLEVKFNKHMPQHIKGVLNTVNAAQRCAISNMCCADGTTRRITMSATDIIRRSVLENFQVAGDLTLENVAVTLALAFVLGLFILLVYRLTFGGVIFSKSFGAR